MDGWAPFGKLKVVFSEKIYSLNAFPTRIQGTMRHSSNEKITSYSTFFMVVAL